MTLRARTAVVAVAPVSVAIGLVAWLGFIASGRHSDDEHGDDGYKSEPSHPPARIVGAIHSSILTQACQERGAPVEGGHREFRI